MSKKKPDNAAKVTDEIFKETVKSDRKKSLEEQQTKVQQTKNLISTSNTVAGNASHQKKKLFPQKKAHPLEVLLGTTAIRNSGDTESIKSVATYCSDGVLGLYVSAHWCPPCRKFTPELMLTYHYLKNHEKKIEVVFITCDSGLDAFSNYFKFMPWLAVPFGDDRLETILTTFGIQGIPALLFLEPNTGEVLARNGVEIVKADPRGELFPWKNFPKSKLKPFSGPPIQNDKPAPRETSGTRVAKRVPSIPLSVSIDQRASSKAQIVSPPELPIDLHTTPGGPRISRDIPESDTLNVETPNVENQTAVPPAVPLFFTTNRETPASDSGAVIVISPDEPSDVMTKKGSSELLKLAQTKDKRASS